MMRVVVNLPTACSGAEIAPAGTNPSGKGLTTRASAETGTNSGISRAATTTSTWRTSAGTLLARLMLTTSNPATTASSRPPIMMIRPLRRLTRTYS
jgi:hypothetical protein